MPAGLKIDSSQGGDVCPVSDACEAAGVPCLSTMASDKANPPPPLRAKLALSNTPMPKKLYGIGSV
jgi:hypothetical protein